MKNQAKVTYGVENQLPYMSERRKELEMETGIFQHAVS